MLANEAIDSCISAMKESRILQEDFTIPSEGRQGLEAHMQGLALARMSSGDLMATSNELQHLVVGFIIGYASANHKLGGRTDKSH